MMNAIVKPLAGGLLAAGVICAPCAGVGGSADSREPQGAVLAAASLDGELPADTARVRLAISGMTCGSCATTARVVLRRVPGVLDARVSYDSASAVVLYDDSRTSPGVFIERLEQMTGYEARVEAAEGASDAEGASAAEGAGATDQEGRREPAGPARSGTRST